MSRPMYQRASSTNLRPGTAARVLEGKLAIVSAILNYTPPNRYLLRDVGRALGATYSSCSPSPWCYMTCLPLRSHIDSDMCRSQEHLEVCLQHSIVHECELKRNMKESALPLPVISPPKVLLSFWATRPIPRPSLVRNLLLLWRAPMASMPLRSRRIWVIHRAQLT